MSSSIYKKHKGVSHHAKRRTSVLLQQVSIMRKENIIIVKTKERK